MIIVDHHGSDSTDKNRDGFDRWAEEKKNILREAAPFYPKAAFIKPCSRLLSTEYIWARTYEEQITLLTVFYLLNGDDIEKIVSCDLSADWASEGPKRVRIVIDSSFRV